MNGNDDQLRTSGTGAGKKRRRTDQSKGSRPVSNMTLAQKMDWAGEVERDLDPRCKTLSTNAQLIGAVISTKKLMQLLIEAGCWDNLPHPKPIGDSGDYHISKVTPQGWQCLENLVENNKFSPRNNECKVSLQAPYEYLEYHDLSVILHLDAKYYPEDIAMEYPDGLPKPIRIFRIYKNNGERAKCVRLVFKDLNQRALVLQRRKIKLWGRTRRVQPMKNRKSRTPAGGKRRPQGRHE